jgi:hypothetical protein
LIDKPGTYMLKVTDPESGCTNEANIAVTEEKE